MKEERCEGIVLKAVEYKDRERIITLFTDESGLIHLIVKGVKKAMLLTTPFCHGEFVYHKGRSDLYRFQDGTVIEDHIKLRASLSQLKAAGDMVQALLHSQLPGKPSPKLFELFSACLKHLPEFSDPLPLTLAFRLKLLAHDGLLHWETLPSHLKELGQARSFNQIRATKVDIEAHHTIIEKFKLLT